MPSEIVGPQVHFVEARSWREDTHVWWKACDIFLRRTGAQMSPCPLHTAAQPRLTLQARITGSQYFASGKTAEAKLIDQNSHTPGTTPGLPYNPTTGRRSYHRRRGRLTRQFGWQFASASRQFGIGSTHRHFCCSVHSPNRGTLPLGPRQFGWQFARGTRQFGNMFSAIRLLGACPKRGYIGHSAGNSGGNSRAIHGNSGRFSAIRVFCACPKRRKFGNSLPTHFPFKNLKKGKRTEYPWMHCARSNNSRILPRKTLETGG